jgi:hypothetical protein
MFGPQHLKYVITYLDGVDRALSPRMLRKHPLDEPALTNELCALLDADTAKSAGPAEVAPPPRFAKRQLTD